MNDKIHHDGKGGFETQSFREFVNAVKGPEERLKVLYADRLRLYKKGCNDEKLNDKIRLLQKETGYKIKE